MPIQAAADGGRARARTLMFIPVIGPDLIDQHLTRLDARLGASRPGPAALASMAPAARTASSPCSRAFPAST
ncbi:MAG: hypothetical protein M3Y33_14430 [Actinomycetota bacterium]|nr:hypothetical protein [Actinomycetota bacterium]